MPRCCCRVGLLLWCRTVVVQSLHPTGAGPRRVRIGPLGRSKATAPIRPRFSQGRHCCLLLLLQVRAESEAVKAAMEHSKAEIDTARALHAEASRDKDPR